jgi:hypothetical protein
MNWNDWFEYDESSVSCLRWKVDRYAGGRQLVAAGDEAGTIGGQQYYRVQLQGKIYTVHLIIWELLKGGVPESFEVDHENRVKTDNKIGNLRLVSKSVNCRNRRLRSDSKTKLNGVTKRERTLPSGSSFVSWVGRYVNKAGERLSKEFSTSKYGQDGAKQAAITFINQCKLADDGGSYTDTHGKEQHDALSDYSAVA